MRTQYSPSPAPSLPPETQYRPAGSDEDDPEYAVLTLLGEDPLQRRYLVEWGDIDKKTGYRFKPTWEPKDLCTNALIKEWKEKLAAKKVKKGKAEGERALAEWEREKARHFANKKKKKKGVAVVKRKERESTRESEESMEAGPSAAAGLEDEEEEEEEEEQEVLLSPEEQKKNRRAKEKAKAKAKALAEASQVTTGSEWLPPNNNKRKRSSVAAGEPAKKKKGKTSTSTNDVAPLPKRTSGRTSRAAIVVDGSPPIASRVRSRSVSTVASVAGQPARANGKKPSALGTQKNTRFATDPPVDDGDEADSEVVENEENQFDDQDDHGNEHDFNFFDDPPHADNEPYRSPSPLPPSEGTADQNARLAAAIRDLSTTGDTAVAAAIPAPASRESSLDSAMIAQAVMAAEALRPASNPSPAPAPAPTQAAEKAKKSKSKSRKDAPAAGPSKAKKLVPVPQPATQVFRVAALQQQAATQANGTQSTGTQESIQQFSSPLGPAKEKDKGKRRAAEPDMNVHQMIAQVEDERAGTRREPLFTPHSSSDEEDVAGVLRTNSGPQDLFAPTAPAPAQEVEEEEEEDEGSVPPGMERRVVDGVAMLRAIQRTPELEETQAVVPRPVMVDRGTTPVLMEKEVSVEPTQFSTGNPENRDVGTGTSPPPVADPAPAPPAPAPPAPAPAPVPSDNELLLLNADLTSQLSSVRAELSDVRAKNKSLQSDNNFFREQYKHASDAAVSEVRVANDLRNRLKIKEQQLVNGLKQKDLHVAAVAARDRQLLATLQAQNKVLLDQARLTGDALRAKAVAYPQTKKENENLLRENGVLERRVEILNRRNEDLVTQISELRARQMGILPDGGESETEGSSGSGSEYTDDGGEQDMATLGYATRPINMTSSGEFFEPSRRDGEEGEMEIKEEEVDVGEIEEGEGLAYACQVRSQEGDTRCGQLLEDRNGLQEHWMSTHRPYVQPMSQ